MILKHPGYAIRGGLYQRD